MDIHLGPERPEDVRCDFCSTALNRATVWSYPCESFEPSVFRVPGLTQTSVTDWAACDICHALIEQEAWDTLAKRSVESYSGIDLKSRTQRRVFLKQLKQLHLEFNRHRRGPPYRMPGIG